MIIVGILFVLCMYLAALIGKIFQLREQTVAGLCMWCFLFVMCCVFYVLSLPAHEVFH